jgi:hypothetical protein
MKKIKLLTGLFLTMCFYVNAQTQKAIIPTTAKVISQATKSPQYTVNVAKEIKPISLDLKWKPLLNNRCIKHHSKNDLGLQQIKNQKMMQKQNEKLNTPETEITGATAAVTPVVGSNFLGNTNTGNSPMDNSVAISNGGKIISVANNSIEFYNTNGTMTFTNTIDGFFNDPTITNVCDPVVIYDSGADKFIFFAQECSGNSSNSNILVCFSQTNDPNGNWWNYKFSGNPANNNTWFDYPKIAVSTNELYVTGNSFSNSSIFEESLLYQIEKNSGYTGGTINWQYWNNITSSPFTLLPVSSGQQGNYGPGCYLVSTQSSGSSTIDLYDLTDDMSASNETLNHYSISTTAYSPAADGNQSGTITQLDNGDCRALSGFYQNGIIHFVFHSDYSNGYNGINYNRLNVTTQTNTSATFGLTGYEYSYPSVASFATSTTDKSVMIGFGRTGSNIYPEIRVINCDDNMTFGASKLVKSGTGYADYTASAGSAERWGDYTGICRKHNNSAPTVWMNGMFGTTTNDWETWIAEITGTGGTTTIANEPKSDNFKLYPNPIYQEFKTEFELSTNSKISIDIFDIQGKLLKTLFNGNAIAGKNQFTFNKSNLGIGTYLIIISSNNQTLKNEKIIIAN